jgi:predicted dinucleotide-binding enzyme
MNIGIFGTGGVGRTIGAHLATHEHTIMLGTRDVAATLAHTDTDMYGNPPFTTWHDGHPVVRIGTFAQVAAHGDVLINATAGHASLNALGLADRAHLNGKILIDISNPLDFSRGMPPSLFVSNTDSLAEQIQRAFPELKVVKTLNSVTAAVMVNPGSVAGGDHDMFVSGDHDEAREHVAEFLRVWFGWQNVIDLGDLRAARAQEMLLPIWLSLLGVLGTPMFNLKVVR